MKFAEHETGMFSGTIHDQLVYSSHPIIVVDADAVVGSFQTLIEAQNFIRGGGKYSAQIYRHDGQEWVNYEFRPKNPLLTSKRRIGNAV